MALPNNPIAQDMQVLSGLLQNTVAPHLRSATKNDLRILNLACGQCDEAETLVNFAKSQTEGAVQLIGADIRIREILQARAQHSHLPAEFLLEDATKLQHHKQLGEDFNMVLLRHQNYWHGPELWKRIFEQGLARMDENGLLVITSYFDKEHQLALEALDKLGAELITTHSNQVSRQLLTPGKSIDKHIAVFRRR
ncbi:class I SAM-dependent methyltransferase [Phragmitibacter flavus]|uniref:Class I SAM-dependent methyltransferase n=1 Tax=Phragmitibacter flavus TaxID=2576071 RepID=A0A5R8KJV7_9BACT|nr:class I SAM-dependent methyltransferase [Phragmitibacter flavus]TLD72608.1 class I SAM-dependent methyltransferase [Phragmitibacter flavus]